MENIEITLEKIELVKDRTGVSYREAKETLEAAGGSVVDAIIAIEDKIERDGIPEKDSKFNAIMNAVKEAVHKGNVNKLTVSKNGETVLNIPLNVGLVGTVLFPWAGLAAAIAAFGTKCSITMTKDNGEIIDISEKADGAFGTIVSKGSVIVDEVADKGENLWEAAKTGFGTAVDKGEEILNAAKDRIAKKAPEDGPAEAAEVIEEDPAAQAKAEAQAAADKDFDELMKKYNL